jgi:hypothetical protein
MYSSVGCSSCSSKNQRKFDGELALHFPGLEGLDKPIVWAFPEVLLCLDCGCAAFALENDPLKEARDVYADDDSSDTNSLARAV